MVSREITTNIPLIGHESDFPSGTRVDRYNERLPLSDEQAERIRLAFEALQPTVPSKTPASIFSSGEMIMRWSRLELDNRTLYALSHVSELAGLISFSVAPAVVHSASRYFETWDLGDMDDGEALAFARLAHEDYGKSSHGATTWANPTGESEAIIERYKALGYIPMGSGEFLTMVRPRPAANKQV